MSLNVKLTAPHLSRPVVSKPEASKPEASKPEDSKPDAPKSQDARSNELWIDIPVAEEGTVIRHFPGVGLILIHVIPQRLLQALSTLQTELRSVKHSI